MQCNKFGTLFERGWEAKWKYLYILVDQPKILSHFFENVPKKRRNGKKKKMKLTAGDNGFKDATSSFLKSWSDR
jgi:hypothetical protein